MAGQELEFEARLGEEAVRLGESGTALVATEAAPEERHASYGSCDRAGAAVGAESAAEEPNRFLSFGSLQALNPHPVTFL